MPRREAVLARLLATIVAGSLGAQLESSECNEQNEDGKSGGGGDNGAVNRIEGGDGQVHALDGQQQAEVQGDESEGANPSQDSAEDWRVSDAARWGHVRPVAV